MRCAPLHYAPLHALSSAEGSLPGGIVKATAFTRWCPRHHPPRNYPRLWLLKATGLHSVVPPAQPTNKLYTATGPTHTVAPQHPRHSLLLTPSPSMNTLKSAASFPSHFFWSCPHYVLAIVHNICASCVLSNGSQQQPGGKGLCCIQQQQF